MEWQAELELAKQAAVAAGRRLKEIREGEPTILSDHGRDIKLQADRDAEAIILEALSESGHPVLAEESGEHGDFETGATAWIVDPLDGTLNYSRGVPICCVSIGLATRQQPLAGVVYDFNRDELYSGIAGEGAWLNDIPMRVSGIDQPAKAILTTGFPVNRDYSEGPLKDFVSRLQRFKKVRLLGSAALSLAYVACGRADAYAEEDIMYWDVAAGLALVLGAGGVVHVRDSANLKWGKQVLVGSTGDIWREEVES
jgi:myo-inositol-1(or 4)-monophosphatase